MESTPKSTQARYISHGCQKHSKLRLRPLQFVQDYKAGPHSIHSNTSLTSLFEESSLCSSLGEVDTSWFDNERWTSNEETKWKREEDILKTPQASQRESKVGSTPGLFTPDGLSPVARRQKDYTECHPPPDEEEVTSSFAQPKRFRKAPSSIHTTPNSQIITSHQPASGPTAETIEEEEVEGDDVAEFQDQPVEIQFSPFPTWNPTHQKDTPIFMKQLFKTPSTLFGAGDKRACSTPLQRLSTPQRLSRSLGAEPEESDFSWTSSLATPPMSSKGSKTVTSSTKKGIEDDSWQTHVVAKVLFKDGGSVVEVDSCEEGDEGSTQPLQVIKLPSMTDESQEEEFTMETEDGGESDKSVAERSKAISVLGDKQCDSSDVSDGIKLTVNLQNDKVANCTVSTESLVPPSTSVQSTLTDRGKPHLANQERHDSVNEYSHVHKAPDQYFKEKSSVREKDESVTNVELGMNSAAELKSRINLSRECTDTNVSSKLALETHGSVRRHPSIQSAMSSQETPIIGSNYASQTLFNSQESTKNEKPAIEETLAFLLATPPSRREKLLDSLCATGVSMVESTPTEQSDGDAAGSALEIKCDVPFTSNDLMKGVSDDSLMSPPPDLFRIPTTSGHTSGELDRNPVDSDCSRDVKTNVRLVETPNRPAPDVDLLSPISPNFAEALCRVTDNASKAQLDGSNSTLTLQKCLGVERNLIGDFDNPDSDTARSQVTVLDYLRSGDHTDILVEKDLHPVGTTEQNAIAEHLSLPITSRLPSSANKQLPKHLLSKQEIRSVMPSAMSSSTSNLNTQTITKGRFTYTAPMARKNEAIASKTPSWLTRAIYVEEDEEKEDTSESTQAETKDVSLKKPWTMKRPCRTATSFTTFSTFCKTAPNPPTRIMSSTQSQKGLRTSTTPTSSRSIIQSAPPHNRTLVRIREIPHSWPSPKRLRLEEERDERPAENGLEDTSAAVNEHEIGLLESRGSSVSDAKSHPVQDLDKITTDQNGLGDFRDMVNSKDHVSSSEGDLHQTRSQRQDTANQIAPNGGFSSASGKAIFVSSEALKKAERLLEDVDREKPPEEFQLNLSAGDKQCGFQSASGKSIAISEAALSKAKKIIAEVSSHEEDTHVPNITQPTSQGFTSARGSVIKVSEAAMAKARKMMNDISEDEETDTALHEETVKQTSHIPDVGGGGDRSRIHSGEVEHTMTLPGNVLPQRGTDNRQRHKGFRPFKPPCLVVKVQKPSNSPPPMSISSINTDIATDVIKESERKGRLETCRISVPDDLQAPIIHRNVVVPEPQQNDCKNFEASKSSLDLEQNEDRQKLTDTLNRQPVSDSELDISEDDCLSASQAAREIKAAEEMELVYNFMQEEDAGFSQLDVSSILAADHIEKRAAQVPRYMDTPKDLVQKKEGITSIYHEQQEPVHHQMGTPIGAVGEPTDGNKETLANNLERESQLDVAFVQSHLLTRSCESKDERILPSLKCVRKETLDRHSPKPTGEDHAHEIDASNGEVPIADLSLNSVRQLMNDSSILIDEPRAVGSNFGEEKVQKEMFSHIDNSILHHSKADARKLLRTSQESTTVTEIECTDEPRAHGKSDPKKKWNPNSSTETSKLDGDSSQEQLKQEKMLLRDQPGSRTDNNSEAYSPVGFKTAGGKKIQISESALQKASLLLSECNSDVERVTECSTEISGEFLNQHVPTSSGHDICRPDDMHPEENMEFCESDDQNHTKDLVNIGFQTARGNKVHVLRSALQKARKMLEADIEDISDCAPGGSTMLTLNTYVSETLPNTTCDMDKDLTIVESEQVPQKSSLTSSGQFLKTVGFQTASGNVVTVSDDSLSRAKQLFAECDVESAISPSPESGLKATNHPKAVGFQTASGSKITVSDNALQKARKLLSSEMERSNEDAIEKAARDSLPGESSSMVGFQTASGNFSEISESSLLKDRQHLASDTESCNARDMHTDLPDNLGSVTAAGSATNMNSEMPLPKARQVRARPEDPFGDSYGQTGSFDTKNSAPRQIGFQTARGGFISVSDDSLRKAQQLLGSDVPDEHIQERGEMKQTVAESTRLMTGFQTGSGKSIHTSESAMQAAKQMLLTDEDLLSTDVDGSEAPNNGHPGPAQSKVGFQAGGGRRIEISKSSLLKARQLFSDEIDANQNVLKSEPSGPRNKDDSKPADMESTRIIGFQTGGGKKIKISAESLQHACSLLGSEYEEADKVARSPKSQELRNENVTVGFRTGHGTKVQISETSLQKAKHFLDDETDALPYESSAVGFQTGHGKKVQISEASLQKAKRFFADETDALPHESTAVGFQTGHGKKVQISEASLQKAKRFLADETDALPHESTAVGFQTGHGKKVQISEASLQKAKRFFADETDALPHESTAVGFQTGHGKKVQISEASLQKAKRFLADETDALPHESTAVGFQTGHGKKVQISEASLQKAKRFLADETDALPHESTAVGFQTGHGKKVQISEASLQKAKRFLADETDALPHESTAVGFQTAHGKKVHISEESITKAKQFLAEGNDTLPEPLRPDQKRAVGFQTAQGEMVQISEASIQRAKQVLADGNGPGTEATSKDSAVHAEAQERPLSGKPSEMAGFMTGNARKVQVSEASLQQARNMLDAKTKTDPISKEHSRKQLNGGQQQPLASIAVDGNMSCQSKDLKKEAHFGQERIGVSVGEDHSLEMPSNLPQRRSEAGGLKRRGSMDMRNRTSNQQRNMSRGSRGTGQKPYKPPRRVSDKGSPSDRGLIPRCAHPTAVLSDRTKQLKALQSSPPTRQSTSLCVSDASIHHAGPFVKPHQDQDPTNQTQSQSEATPTQAEGGCSFVARWAEARRAQQQRIDAKRDKVIKPELGSLWQSRKQQDRISLRDFVDHQHPCSMSDSELFGHGILSSTLSVRPSNAEEYEFAGEDHFSPSCLESNQGIPLANGGKLVLSPNGLAGKKEFYSALLDTPGVDPKLLKEEWAFNHYKWIIWKAAAMEVAYPLQLGGRFLTPNWVLLQLKYRYDREIDHSQRPALRKILERDDAASRRMVLCVSAVESTGSSAGQDGKGGEQRKNLATIAHPTLELTDGWYSIPAAIDPPLANYVRSGKIMCGTKLCIYGAELVGSQDACSPLEIPEGLKLKISANSTRRACYDARLGLQADLRPFPLPTTSLHPDGGTVGCVDVLVLRTYPMQFMEKLPEGGSVFRNAKEEAKAAALHASQKHNKMEQLFTQIQKEFEAKQASKGQGGKMKRSLSSSRGRRDATDIEKLQSGEELFEAMEAAIDPAAFESVLSEHQQTALHAYQRSQNEMKQADMQAAFNRALAKQNKEGKFERAVVPLLKVRVTDYKASTTKGQQTTFLTIWQPTDDLVTQLIEGKRFRISSLSTSTGRNMPGMAPVQLASTRATRYEELPAASHILQKSYIPRAAASMQWLGRGFMQAAYGELDVVGVVVSSEEPNRYQPGSSQCHAVYLADQDAAIMAIKFWTSPTALNLDDMLKPGSFISMSNLQYRSVFSTPSAVTLPTATASDNTTFTPNPKAGYLQAALNQLKAGIKDVPKFVEMMQRRVQSLKDAPSQLTYAGSTPRNHPFAARRDWVTTPLAGMSWARSGIQSSPPTSVTPQGQPYQLMTVRSCPKNFLKTSCPSSVTSKDGALNPRVVQVAGSTPPHIHPGGTREPTTPTVKTPCQSPVSVLSEMGVSPRLMAQHIEQERRSQLLSRIPSPPPLTPLPFPAAASALKRGFKIPSPLVRGSQKTDPEKSLRKRLRDELEEQEDTDSGQPCSHQSGVGCHDSDNTNKKQKVNNHADTPHQNEVKSPSEDHSNPQQSTEDDTEHDEGEFGDDLGLSASGLRELEMSWSQSESLPEPVARDQVLQMNSCKDEASCPSTSKDSLDNDKDDVSTEVSLEKADHYREELQREKRIAYAIAEAKEGAFLACKDTVSVHEAKHDAVPHSEPLSSEQYDDRIGVNCDDPTDPTIEAVVLEPSPRINSDCKMDNTAETTSIGKLKVSSTHVLSPHLETIDEDMNANSSVIIENIKEVADVPEQVNPNLQDPEVMQETHEAQNHMNSQGSVSANPKDSTKEDSLQESNELQQSRNDSPSQNLTPGDGSQESSKQDPSPASSSPKGNKRKCLSLRGRRPVPEADAVIEILEDDDSPLPKRSSRLIRQQKKSYKL